MLRYIYIRDTGKCYALYLVTLFQTADISICVCQLYSYKIFLAKTVKSYIRCIQINIPEYISVSDSRKTNFSVLCYLFLIWSDNEAHMARA